MCRKWQEVRSKSVGIEFRGVVQKWRRQMEAIKIDRAAGRAVNVANLKQGDM